MEYLLRDEMGLFGPASTYFPLQVVYDTFLEDEGSMRKEGVAFVESVVLRLVQAIYGDMDYEACVSQADDISDAPLTKKCS